MKRPVPEAVQPLVEELPTRDGRRAKALRPHDRDKRALRAGTEAALRSFERVGRAYEAARLQADDAVLERWFDLRTAAARSMVALEDEWRVGSLPAELARELLAWDEGVFVGSLADVEISLHALAVLLGSPLRLEMPAWA